MFSFISLFNWDYFFIVIFPFLIKTTLPFLSLIFYFFKLKLLFFSFNYFSFLFFFKQKNVFSIQEEDRGSQERQMKSEPCFVDLVGTKLRLVSSGGPLQGAPLASFLCLPLILFFSSTWEHHKQFSSSESSTTWCLNSFHYILNWGQPAAAQTCSWTQDSWPLTHVLTAVVACMMADHTN